MRSVIGFGIWDKESSVTLAKATVTMWLLGTWLHRCGQFATTDFFIYAAYAILSIFTYKIALKIFMISKLYNAILYNMYFSKS